jgi:hypothetical protein
VCCDAHYINYPHVTFHFFLTHTFALQAAIKTMETTVAAAALSASEASAAAAVVDKKLTAHHETAATAAATMSGKVAVNNDNINAAVAAAAAATQMEKERVNMVSNATPCDVIPYYYSLFCVFFYAK